MIGADKHKNMIFCPFLYKKLIRFAEENTKIAELNAFRNKLNILHLSGEKAIISLIPQYVQPTYKAPANKETKDNIEIHQATNLRNLSIPRKNSAMSL